MIYAGIGARATPSFSINIMNKFGKFMGSNGHVLRSGAAYGADAAFEKGCDEAQGMKEIFIPWKGFNDSLSELFDVSIGASNLAKKFHPAWSKLSQGGQKLMARNCYQLLGYDLNTPSDFVVCWTKDGYNLGMERSPASGGTGQAIEIALSHEIKVYNIFNTKDLEELRSLTQSFKSLCS